MIKTVSPQLPSLPPAIPAQVAGAIAEDLGPGDVTAALVPADATARARVISREPGVLCGTAWVDETFSAVSGGQIHVHWHLGDGERCDTDTPLCEIEGPARALLTAERTALNFLQTLSGTATAARRYVDALGDDATCRLLDTRKTLPGLRLAQKYAVRCGGGANHRIGLFDGVLIKENHIAAGGGIAPTVAAARAERSSLAVEVEVESLDELSQAMAAGADIAMLDNFTLEDMRTAVARVRDAQHPMRLEASGDITLDNAAQVAATGVDFISIGALTKHVRALDLSLRILEVS
ncbi:MAG: carboxylating nicotinate-nucleotide diphosphorylase [Pseudomonadota bacterium]